MKLVNSQDEGTKSDMDARFAGVEIIPILTSILQVRDQRLVVPDADVRRFNSMVLSENFNRVVCYRLVRDVDPLKGGRTLVVCANDRHAGQVVRLLREAYACRSNEVATCGVVTLPPESAEARLPRIMVIGRIPERSLDVPKISNLVILCRMGDRDRQTMEDIVETAKSGGGEILRIFDGVDISSILEIPRLRGSGPK